jgi:hypothetical protein
VKARGGEIALLPVSPFRPSPPKFQVEEREGKWGERRGEGGEERDRKGMSSRNILLREVAKGF